MAGVDELVDLLGQGGCVGVMEWEARERGVSYVIPSKRK